MIDTTRGLQPLKEAEAAIARLQDYESTEELAAAIVETNAAVQRSLRYLLRADKGAPDDLRLAALSPNEMSVDRVIPALRQRNLISLELAGQIHELDQVAQRAAQQNVRAADGDFALRVVDQLTAEIQDAGERSVRAVAHNTVEAGALNEVHSVPPDTTKKRGAPSALLAALLALAAVALVLWLTVFKKSETEKGIAQFDAKQYSAAEQTLSAVVDKDPGDAQAAYYLAVLYRRSERHDEAGKVLQRAIDKNPEDVYLREELGNLFMTLGRPELAAKQYRVAQERNPEETRYWVKLVSALRAANDPAAEATLQQAPEEARALLNSPR
jgi:tetratricopeptide (TPR) repeat protein